MPGTEAVLQYLAQIDKNLWYTNFGPLLREFEGRLGKLFDPDDYLVTTSSGTSALELALLALDLPRGANVLLPAFTFIATATAVTRAGCTPALADVDSNKWILTTETARDAAKKLPLAAVMPVSTFGHPQDISAWDRFVGETGIPVIIDAAGAFGNQRVGSRTIVCFSFHATKSFGTSEGGLVVAKDQGFIEKVRRLTNFGIDLTSGLVSCAGTNAKLSEYHAAVGLANLDRWPETTRRRRQLWQTYTDLLSEHCGNLTFQDKPTDGIYSILSICLPKDFSRATIVNRLLSFGVETRAWFCPLIHDHPVFRDIWTTGSLPIARDMSRRLLGIPFHLKLTTEDQEYVARRIRDSFGRMG